MTNYVLDTNILISFPHILDDDKTIYNLDLKSDSVVIYIMTDSIKELDKISNSDKNRRVRFTARTLLKKLEQFQISGCQKILIFDNLIRGQETDDSLILGTLKLKENLSEDITFITNDTALAIRARAAGISVSNFYKLKIETKRLIKRHPNRR